ncbi:MAG: prepilin-type N-terminal cleavage/methylation domain-containing protein [Candidatus Riflebacteria bacterium]|nr:prepilin-type N-terminal cleavage/methylation domain-containing protein [Candidatus Riflebacteria bacterium]
MKKAFSLVELLVAVAVFSIAGLPIFSLYFNTGLGQQKLIRDFLAVTTVTEKVINRVNQEIEEQNLPMARFNFDKNISNSITKGQSQDPDLKFLDNSFVDKSGEAAFRYIQHSESRFSTTPFTITKGSVPASHRSNNPELLQEVLTSIEKRSKLLEVTTQWRDTSRILHDFNVILIKAVVPES